MRQILITIPDNATASDVFRAIATALEVPGTTGEELWRKESGFPKVLRFDGVDVMCYAPINPDWMPSMQAHILGAQGAFVTEPAYPQGSRSPAGFPMVGNQVQWGERGYPDDQAVFNAIAQYRATAPSTDGDNQGKLQPGQVDVKTIPYEQLEGLLVAIARNEVGLAEKYGPTKLMHELSALMHASGIHEDASRPGFIVPPPSFPELADMTVQRAKELAGLAEPAATGGKEAKGKKK